MKDKRLDRRERQARSGRSWDWSATGNGQERGDPRVKGGADERCGWNASFGTVCGELEQRSAVLNRQRN